VAFPDDFYKVRGSAVIVLHGLGKQLSIEKPYGSSSCFENHT